jgi:transcriptional regulator with XRE-family HTH domain
MTNVERNHNGVPQWTTGDRLAKARRHAGLSRDDMADYLGLTPQAIGNYELDKRPIKVGMVRLWAMRCGVDFEWLRTGEEPRGKGPRGADKLGDQPQHGSRCRADNVRRLPVRVIRDAAEKIPA